MRLLVLAAAVAGVVEAQSDSSEAGQVIACTGTYTPFKENDDGTCNYAEVTCLQDGWENVCGNFGSFYHLMDSGKNLPKLVTIADRVNKFTTVYTFNDNKDIDLASTFPALKKIGDDSLGQFNPNGKFISFQSDTELDYMGKRSIDAPEPNDNVAGRFSFTMKVKTLEDYSISPLAFETVAITITPPENNDNFKLPRLLFNSKQNEAFSKISVSASKESTNSIKTIPELFIQKFKGIVELKGKFPELTSFEDQWWHLSYGVINFDDCILPDLTQLTMPTFQCENAGSRCLTEFIFDAQTPKLQKIENLGLDDILASEIARINIRSADALTEVTPPFEKGSFGIQGDGSQITSIAEANSNVELDYSLFGRKHPYIIRKFPKIGNIAAKDFGGNLNDKMIRLCGNLDTSITCSEHKRLVTFFNLFGGDECIKKIGDGEFENQPGQVPITHDFIFEEFNENKIIDMKDKTCIFTQQFAHYMYQDYKFINVGNIQFIEEKAFAVYDADRASNNLVHGENWIPKNWPALTKADENVFGGENDGSSKEFWKNADKVCTPKLEAAVEVHKEHGFMWSPTRECTYYEYDADVQFKKGANAGSDCVNPDGSPKEGKTILDLGEINNILSGDEAKINAALGKTYCIFKKQFAGLDDFMKFFEDKIGPDRVLKVETIEEGAFDGIGKVYLASDTITEIKTGAFNRNDEGFELVVFFMGTEFTNLLTIGANQKADFRFEENSVFRQMNIQIDSTAFTGENVLINKEICFLSLSQPSINAKNSENVISPRNCKPLKEYIGIRANSNSNCVDSNGDPKGQQIPLEFIKGEDGKYVPNNEQTATCIPSSMFAKGFGSKFVNSIVMTDLKALKEIEQFAFDGFDNSVTLEGMENLETVDYRALNDLGGSLTFKSSSSLTRIAQGNFRSDTNTKLELNLLQPYLDYDFSDQPPLNLDATSTELLESICAPKNKVQQFGDGKSFGGTLPCLIKRGEAGQLARKAVAVNDQSGSQCINRDSILSTKQGHTILTWDNSYRIGNTELATCIFKFQFRFVTDQNNEFGNGATFPNVRIIEQAAFSQFDSNNGDFVLKLPSVEFVGPGAFFGITRAADMTFEFNKWSDVNAVSSGTLTPFQSLQPLGAFTATFKKITNVYEGFFTTIQLPADEDHKITFEGQVQFLKPDAFGFTAEQPVVTFNDFSKFQEFQLGANTKAKINTQYLTEDMTELTGRGPNEIKGANLHPSTQTKPISICAEQQTPTLKDRDANTRLYIGQDQCGFDNGAAFKRAHEGGQSYCVDENGIVINDYVILVYDKPNKQWKSKPQQANGDDGVSFATCIYRKQFEGVKDGFDLPDFSKLVNLIVIEDAAFFEADRVISFGSIEMEKLSSVGISAFKDLKKKLVFKPKSLKRLKFISEEAFKPGAVSYELELPDLPELTSVSPSAFGDNPAKFEEPTFWKSVCTQALPNKVDLDLSVKASWASDRFCADHLEYKQEERSGIQDAETECDPFLPLKFNADTNTWDDGTCITKNQFKDYEGFIPGFENGETFSLTVNHVSEGAFENMNPKNPVTVTILSAVPAKKRPQAHENRTHSHSHNQTAKAVVISASVSDRAFLNSQTDVIANGIPGLSLGEEALKNTKTVTITDCLFEEIGTAALAVDSPVTQGEITYLIQNSRIDNNIPKDAFYVNYAQANYILELFLFKKGFSNNEFTWQIRENAFWVKDYKSSTRTVTPPKWFEDIPEIGTNALEFPDADLSACAWSTDMVIRIKDTHIQYLKNEDRCPYVQEEYETRAIYYEIDDSCITTAGGIFQDKLGQTSLKQTGVDANGKGIWNTQEATCIPSYQFYNEYYDPDSLPDWKLLRDLKIIENSAFNAYANDVTFPETLQLTDIKAGAFAAHLGKITLPILDKLETIGDRAFNVGNVPITLTGPFDNLKEIGEEAFHGHTLVEIDTQNEDMPLLETFPGFDETVTIKASDTTICTPKLQTPVKHKDVSLSKQHCPRKNTQDEHQKVPEGVYVAAILAAVAVIVAYVRYHTPPKKSYKSLPRV